MNTRATAATLAPVSVELTAAVEGACARIAPTWPLDQFIAVNPYWGWRAAPIADSAAHLGVLAGTKLTMSRSWFRGEWTAGRINIDHVVAIAVEMHRPELADQAVAALQASSTPEQAIPRMALVTDLADRGPGPVHGRTWTDLAVHQISQFCAAHFDNHQATWAPNRSGGLFGLWRIDPSVTHGFVWALGSQWVRDQLDSLPEAADEAIAVMLADLEIDPSAQQSYLTALLTSINGWAAWCAYRRWQANLVNDSDDEIVQLLAVRLAWEWLLVADIAARGDDHLLAGWAVSWMLVDEAVEELADDQRIDWLLQTALERTFQDSITSRLETASTPSVTPDVQAVFCIDVRSEVFRRSLEAASGRIHTRGFAGFFGLPIDYTPAGTALTRPQLPGLLAPALHVTESVSDERIEARHNRLHDHERWEEFRHDPSSVFSFVESIGLTHSVKLVTDSLATTRAPQHWECEGLDCAHHPAPAPRIAELDDDANAGATVGHRVLKAMGLRSGFAPLVLLCGHGSTTTNNPHAAGLDCGACGGQTGEVNARVLADLLNTPAVRQGIASLGIDIPDTTWFLAGLHDTTTDAVQLFDAASAPQSLQPAIAQLVSDLEAAGRLARRERAASLGLASVAEDPARLERSIRERSNDWSQVRPEWGLTGNAAFVVAPRARTQHLDLGGRAFLHEYDYRLDDDLSVLTLIMTAPMVVTNWINMQYHASTVDNRRYGSGNKVLHNVVGGHIGVFEGNGGDLRIGLPEQSLHDGTRLLHQPVRLSVFIEAPRESIDAVIDAHHVVRDLVEGGWLHLLRIDPATASTERRSALGWS
jgi:uncharacterized protein